ncbi:MAG: GHMP kinase [Methylovirgula sp.]
MISTAIKRFIYITVNPKFDNKVRLSYSRTEEVDQACDVQHRLFRTVLEQQGINGGVEITSVADIPSHGSGLGSSSSFAVGLLNALHAYAGRFVSAELLAREACQIEIERLKDPIGKQDQYAAAYGGLNLIQFNPDDTVDIQPLTHHWSAIKKIESSILVFYTGVTREAGTILAEQQTNVDANREKRDLVGRLVQMAYQFRDDLVRDKVDSFGEMLHESWMLKRQLASGVSSDSIDILYDKARAAGAIGGKILGAGGGGFLLVTAPEERHAAITQALGQLRRIPMYFERLGSLIVFSDRNEK